jgi:hypothetical protein
MPGSPPSINPYGSRQSPGLLVCWLSQYFSAVQGAPHSTRPAALRNRCPSSANVLYGAALTSIRISASSSSSAVSVLGPSGDGARRGNRSSRRREVSTSGLSSPK